MRCTVPANIYIQSERLRWAMHHGSFQHWKCTGAAFFMYFAVKNPPPTSFACWLNVLWIHLSLSPDVYRMFLLCPPVFNLRPNRYRAKRITSPLGARGAPCHIYFPGLPVSTVLASTLTFTKCTAASLGDIHKGIRSECIKVPERGEKNRTSPWDQEWIKKKTQIWLIVGEV